MLLQKDKNKIVSCKVKTLAPPHEYWVSATREGRQGI